MKIGVIRERKVPPDQRVPLTPEQCARLIWEFPVQVVVEPSPIRCFADGDYRAQGIPMRENLEDCDVLMGVKEVPIDFLLPDKTYFFFSHTIKKQPHNRKLLQAVLERRIRLIDYEVITDGSGQRLIAFGRFAGMVGAHNGIMTYGLRTGTFHLPRLKDFLNYAQAVEYYREKLHLPPVKIVLTGTGRVGQGAAAVLSDMGIRQVTPEEFLTRSFDEAVFTQLRCQDYAEHREGAPFQIEEYYRFPERFKSRFAPFTRIADIFINGIFWDKRAPVFFTREEMRSTDFHIRVIADVTCDIAPDSSVPSTLRASTIAEPVFGYDPHTEREADPFQGNVIDVMAIDNLPSELPRDASHAFGEMFIQRVLPELLLPHSAMVERATIAKNGKLGAHFQYLQDYVDGKE